MFSIINLAQDSSKHSRYLSTTLLTHIEKSLGLWEKVLLYLNKRWSHSTSVCRDCGYIWICPNCDVTLHVHKPENKLLCHICSHSSPLPYTCNACWGNHIEFVGLGTKHIEEILWNIFPNSHIYRFDSDALTKVSGKKEALQSIEKADIVIGTKMLTTGFNLKNVWCIAVILVEWELQSPWYDAEEKAFQNIRQLIGRGNRLWQKTEILLQTFSPEQRLIERLTRQAMKTILSESLSERKTYLYPPYAEIAIIHCRDISKVVSIKSLKDLLVKLEKSERNQSIKILYGENSFKKNNEYHTSAIIKWHNLRSFLEHIRSEILKNPKISLQFGE